MAPESVNAVQASPTTRLWRCELLRAALLGAVGWIGFMGGANSSEALTSALVWLGLSSAAVGFCAGRCLRSALWCVPPIMWWAAFALFPSAISSPTLGVLASCALYSLGVLCAVSWGAVCLGTASDERSSPSSAPYAGAACLLFLAGLLSALPSAGGVLAEPLPLEWTAHLLNLSPVVWVAESAGVDWMRHASVYELAGAGDLGPEMRVAWSGWVGPVCALGACVLLLGLIRGRQLFA